MPTFPIDVTRHDPGELGARLLEQHEGLRTRTAQCARLSARLLRGEPVAPQLATELVHLRLEFLDYNDVESRLLEPFLAASDAWGPLRVDRMLEEHAAEHAAFRERLEGTLDEIAARFADFAEDLDAHMAAEERTFLSPKVLADAKRALDRA